MNATVKNISRSGISFYSARNIHPGLKLTLTLNKRLVLHGVRVVRCEPEKPVTSAVNRYVVSAVFNETSCNNEEFLKWIDSLPETIHLVPAEERRIAERKETHISVHVAIPAPKVLDNEFHLLPNGVQCTVDQYIPPFHEIAVITDEKEASNDLSGIVVRCEEVDEGRFALDVFFPALPQNLPPESDMRIAL